MSSILNIRALTHITAGHSNWVATPDEEAKLRKDFLSAVRGDGVFITRSGVRIQTIEVSIPDEDSKMGALIKLVVERAEEHCAQKTVSTMNQLELALSEFRKLREKMESENVVLKNSAEHSGEVTIDGDVTISGTFVPK